MKLVSMPAAEERFGRFAVSVNGRPADVLAARVSAMPFNCGWPGHQRPLDQTEMAGFVLCQSNAPVEVCAAVEETVNEVCVRPLSKGVAVAEESGVMRFTLPGPGQYVLEPNDHHGALHIFVAPETEAPVLKEGDLYYAPGVHDIGIVELQDDQTVVIDAGAVVYGGFAAYGKKNITITGHGILDGSREIRTSETRLINALGIWEGREAASLFLDNDKLRAYEKEHKTLNGLVRFNNCKNCTVEHITCRDSSTFTIVPAACDNILVDDVKMIGMWRYNSDGVDVFNSSNVVIRNSFLRNFDDCVVLKGICGWGHRPLENILTENCVIWCDWGRGLEIGAETNASEYRNILFTDCDVIHGTWLHLDVQHHNDAYIHDVVFDNIRCEYTKHQQPLKMQDSDDQTYEEAKTGFDQPGLLGAFYFDMGLFGAPHNGEKMDRIRFTNIQVLSDEEVPVPTCRFTGLSEACHIEDVTIENLTRNGVRLTDARAANLEYNEFVSGVTLK